ncbi:SNAP25 homologous protein SNAP33-like [Magnolia sinica]|uniref:SNAP25 homologous protein SNAP33-like n=1 Tax=Magnolia sinica TaxID=86752 RepID=UPI00265961E5|nr:SNAP25 homologous protein SNAP33-like [Magnolia sinica]XP_058070301.1 SNAP25 homologous protein SNAP33-like [Magnolia sinica]
MSKSGITKTPMGKVAKQRSSDTGLSGSNPFDSDSDSELKSTPSGYNQGERRGAPSVSSSPFAVSSATRNQYKNDFRESGGLENQSVQELENYAVYKAEETTMKVNSCLKIAEEIREDGTKTLINLHQQGEQITRTHTTAANIDYDLSMGEKLLGSLGGMFSKTWKPKKSRTITGPKIMTDNSCNKKGSHMAQREKLGLVQNPRAQSEARQLSTPSAALEKVEVEKAKQDDALSDLSNLLGELKDMAIDMGSEIGRQNKALDHLHDDVEELNYRVKGANQRGRHLLGK